MVEGGLAALLQKKLADVDRSPEGKLSLVDSFCGSALPPIRFTALDLGDPSISWNYNEFWLPSPPMCMRRPVFCGCHAED